MNEATLIQSEDWEGLFINGKLVEENHQLNEGNPRIKYFGKLAKKYNFKLEEMKIGLITDKYEDYLCDAGNFHENLEDVQYELY